MRCDMVAALARATRDGGTLFGHNCNRSSDKGVILSRMAGRAFAPGERVQIGAIVLPQTRRTWTVLAGRCPGQWGYVHGLNEHGVSIGLTAIRTRRHETMAALTGPDLVRLGLERAASARQAVDVMTDLAGRHGQGSAEAEVDPAFLVVDGREAFVLEMFGPHWALQRIGEVRSVSDVCHLRQDWDQVSHGLADLAIARGWWPGDGSKLDFAAAVARPDDDNTPSMRRWGRATLLLERDNGRIDLKLMRHLLGDHSEGGAYEVDLDNPARAEEAATLCRHAAAPSEPRTAASLIAQSGPGDALPIAWYCFGLPCRNVYFPLVLVGELPAEFLAAPSQRSGQHPHEETDDPEQSAAPRVILDDLQKRFDGETRAFAAEAVELRRRGEDERLARLAGSFMRHNLEVWEDVCLEAASLVARAGPTLVGEESSSSGAWIRAPIPWQRT